MPRANRYITAGRNYHLTHRCHNRSYNEGYDFGNMPLVSDPMRPLLEMRFEFDAGRFAEVVATAPHGVSRLGEGEGSGLD